MSSSGRIYQKASSKYKFEYCHVFLIHNFVTNYSKNCHMTCLYKLVKLNRVKIFPKQQNNLPKILVLLI